MIMSREERLRSARGGLWRSALVWTPLFLASAGGGFYFLYMQLATDSGSGWAVPIILILFGALLGYQSAQSIRDLRGSTATTEGFITRRWSKFDLGMRTSYFRLDNGKILRLDRVQWLQIKKDDYVEVEYFPASMMGVTVEKREPPEGEGPRPEVPEDELPEPDPLLIERN